MMRARFFLLSALWSAALLLASCAEMGSGKAPRAGQVDHVVLVWLKHPGDAAERAKLIEAGRSLASIPGVISVSGGESLPSTRPMVDSSFDVGYVMRFESQAAMEAYVKHPLHVKLAKEVLKPAAQKVVVHDFVIR
jgi:hypothetical protein